MRFYFFNQFMKLIFFRYWRHDVDTAEEYYLKSLEINPNFVRCLREYGNLINYKGIFFTTLLLLSINYDKFSRNKRVLTNFFHSVDAYRFY